MAMEEVPLDASPIAGRRVGGLGGEDVHGHGQSVGVRAVGPLPTVPMVMGASPHVSSPVPRGAGSEAKKKPSGIVAWWRKKSGGSSPGLQQGGSAKSGARTQGKEGGRGKSRRAEGEGFTQGIEEDLGAMRLGFGDASGNGKAWSIAARGGPPATAPPGQGPYVVDVTGEARRVVECPAEFHTPEVREAAAAFLNADRAAHLAVADAASKKSEFLLLAAAEKPRPLFELGDQATPPSLRTSPTTVPSDEPVDDGLLPQGVDVNEIERRKAAARRAWLEERAQNAFLPEGGGREEDASWTPFTNEDTGYISGSDEGSSSSTTPHQSSQGSISPFELTPATPAKVHAPRYGRQEALKPEDCTSSEEASSSGSA